MALARLCWICRNEPANSGEHKYPARYLRRIGADWKTMSHGSFDGTIFHTQGPGSNNFKLPVLCAQCNNARTTKQDHAVDALLRYVAANEDDLWQSRELSLDLDDHDVLDLYRGLLKLEYSRHAHHDVPIHDAVADFVAGGSDWRGAAARTRVTFRAVENLRSWSVSYPSESDLRYFGPFHVQQINFGWFAVHYVAINSDDPPMWPDWDLSHASLAPCSFTRHGAVDPWL